MADKQTPRRVPRRRFQAMIIDFDRLVSSEVVVTDFDRSGCCAVGDGIDEMPETIGLTAKSIQGVIRGRIAWRRNGRAGIEFNWDNTARPDKRREKRVAVTIPAMIANEDGSKKLRCLIVDASRSGCRIKATGLDRLKEKIRLKIEKLAVPVSGRIVWRKDDTAGIELNWNFAQKAPGDMEPPEEDGGRVFI